MFIDMIWKSDKTRGNKFHIGCDILYKRNKRYHIQEQCFYYFILLFIFVIFFDFN